MREHCLRERYRTGALKRGDREFGNWHPSRVSFLQRRVMVSTDQACDMRFSHLLFVYMQADMYKVLTKSKARCT